MKNSKKIISLTITICFIFTSCETTKSLNDYNPNTYSKNNYSDRKILGNVTVSKIDWVWSSYNANDEKTIKLFERLKNKAKRKYGANIELLNISIGDYQSSISVPLYILGGAGFFSGAALCASSEKEIESSSSSEKTKTEITNSGAYGAGLILGSSFLYFFKGVKATAIVAKAEQENIDYKLISESEIEANKKYAIVKRDAQIKEQNRKVEEEKRKIEIANEIFQLKENLPKYQERYETLKTEKMMSLIRINKRIQDLNSPIAIISKGIDSINSVNGVSCHIEFSNVSNKIAKYVKFTVVPINRVFDIVTTEGETVLTVTDFVLDDYKGIWGNIWYNNTIISMEIVKIEVIFTDNSNMTVNSKDIIKQCFYTEDELQEINNIDLEIKKAGNNVSDTELKIKTLSDRLESERFHDDFYNFGR